MEIRHLAGHPDFIPTLARWFHQEWAYLHPDRTLADVEQLIHERTHRDRIPLALVAIEGDELLGTVCLKLQDMDTRAQLTPWLAGLYVAAPRRRQGIGTRLVAAIEQRAKELAVGRLYLYTPESESFYARLGWQVSERCRYHGFPVTVMTKHLSDLRE
jgi:GNAT superfamily N-acetyltransferase